MLRQIIEIPIGRYQRQLMMDAELRQQCIDSPNLHSTLPAKVAESRGRNMIIPTRIKKRKCGETIHDLLLRPCAGKSLQ